MHPEQWETQKLLYLPPSALCPADKTPAAAIPCALTTAQIWANQQTANLHDSFKRWEDKGIPIVQMGKPTLRTSPSWYMDVLRAVGSKTQALD